jgi:cell shape-determining protein MreC
MDQQLIIIKKIVSLITFLLVMGVILGSIFFSHIRANFISLVETISMSHPIIILGVLGSFYWMFSDVPRQMIKFSQSKGDLKKFWEDL